MKLTKFLLSDNTIARCFTDLSEDIEVNVKKKKS